MASAGVGGHAKLEEEEFPTVTPFEIEQHVDSEKCQSTENRHRNEISVMDKNHPDLQG